MISSTPSLRSASSAFWNFVRVLMPRTARTVILVMVWITSAFIAPSVRMIQAAEVRSNWFCFPRSNRQFGQYWRPN